MTTVVDRLDAWLAEHRPEYYSELNEGLGLEQLEQVATSVAQPLPVVLQQLWAWRDGQSDDCCGALFYNREFLASEASLALRDMLNDMLDAGEFEKPGWWNKAWLPLLHNGANGLVCLDFSGAFGGKPGQIIEFWHAEENRTIVAPNIKSWLDAIVASLEANLWEDDDGDFQPKNDDAVNAFLAARLGGHPMDKNAAQQP